jgi:hypothetical protein
LYSVLETLNAKQHQTEEGQRMVNQYRLGPTIGKGGYATVEKGIDVGTGKEYVRPLACDPSEKYSGLTAGFLRILPFHTGNQGVFQVPSQATAGHASRAEQAQVESFSDAY